MKYSCINRLTYLYDIYIYVDGKSLGSGDRMGQLVSFERRLLGNNKRHQIVGDRRLLGNASPNRWRSTFVERTQRRIYKARLETEPASSRIQSVVPINISLEHRQTKKVMLIGFTCRIIEMRKMT